MSLSRNILFAILLAGSAFGATFNVTNNVLLLSPPGNNLVVNEGERIKYTIYARSGSSPIVLSNRTVTGYLMDVDDEPAQTVDGVILDVTNGAVRFTFTNFTPGVYTFTSAVVNASTTAYVVRLSLDAVTITNASSSGGGGDVSVSVTATTVVEVTDGLDTIGINGHQTSSFNFAVSGGGIGIVSNLSDGTFTITNRNVFVAAPGNYTVFQSDGTNYWWGNLFGPNIPAGTIGTNMLFITNSVGAKEMVIIPPGVTNVRWHLWGAGGGFTTATGRGGNGGYVVFEMPVVGGSLYDVYRGLGGSNNAVATSVTNIGGWNGGGNAIASDGRYSASAGGCVSIFIGGQTDLVYLVAAAPGGSGAAGSTAGQFPAQAGGTVGQGGTSNTNAWPGYGAYEANIYGSGAVAGTGQVSAADGGWLYGGTPVITSGVPTIRYLSGGGCGCPGGGAPVGAVSNVTGMIATGGAGVPYVNTNYVSWGYSIRSPTNVVAGLEAATYLPGFGMGSVGSGVAGGAGLAVLEY